MKSLTTSTILMLVASSLIFFFIGRFTAPSSSTVASANVENLTTKGDAPSDGAIALNGETAGRTADDKVAVDKVTTDNPAADNAAATAAAAAKALAEKEAADKAAADKEAADKAAAELANKRVEPSPSIGSSTTLVTSDELNRPKMGISDKKIAQVLSAVAQSLEDKNLAYISSEMQDCSGIFHQMKDSLQTRLPSLANGSQYTYPSPKVARSSRQIANWYHKNNNLLIVQDPMASKNSIRPGAVMFYGKSNRKFKNIDIDMLTDRENNFTSNGAIQHIAVVTAVTLDEDGNVVDYTIMHGRRPGKVAKRSGSKEVQSRNKVLPAFGHWSQQWVGIANMATPKK